MYSCHNTAVFIVVARAACGLQVPTLRRPQDGRKWSAGKFKDMSAHQRDEAHNGGCTPESVLNYLEIWLRHPAPIYMAFSRGLGVNKAPFIQNNTVKLSGTKLRMLRLLVLGGIIENQNLEFVTP